MSVRRDYKSDTTWKSRRRLRLHGLVVITMVVVGLFGTLLAYIVSNNRSQATAQTPPAVAATTAAPPAAPAKTTAPPPPPKPKYNFYQVLPEQQVVISREELKPAAVKPAAKPPLPPQVASLVSKPAPKPEPAPEASAAPPPPKKGRYIVQAGAFRDYMEADKLKADIAFLGVRARIETTTGKDGNPLHRVRIGPVKDAEEAQALRRRLQQEKNIQAIAIKAE